MVIHRTNISLQGKAEDSRGKCPFEPTLKYASLFVDGAFYSATSNNFLGTEPIILRSMRNPNYISISILSRTSFYLREQTGKTAFFMEFFPNNGEDWTHQLFVHTV
ncbi:semaphorin-4C-like [Rhea pennata]|uniref:semaphorin-4C-like n=1 Tax=Rhea pennata TaxID=8795 RepID=UPI002E263A89